MAGLAIGGAGFGAGYAVADSGTDDATTTVTQTGGDDWGDRGMPGDHGPMGDMQVPGAPSGATQGDGSTGQAPDFDGDGEPDATQNS